MKLSLHRGFTHPHAGRIPWGFHGTPVHASTNDGRNFRWLQTFGYLDKAGHWHDIPKHNDSDGASTPRLIWGIVPPFGRHWRPAAAHDHWYRNTQYPKIRCDALFLEAMESCGVSWFWRHVIYWGVKFGGHGAFKGDRAAQSRRKNKAVFLIK
jgi:hypothetical protein